MTTSPIANHVCQCCARRGTSGFVNVGNGRWECSNATACRARSIRAARRQKAACAPLAELPTLLGDGTVKSDGDTAWFSIETGGLREAAVVEYHPNEKQPFQVWVRSWGPHRELTHESESGAFDTSAEAADQVGAILAAIARSQEELDRPPMSTDDQVRDMAQARHEGEDRREGCPYCEDRELSSYPRAADVQAKKNKPWPIA